MSTNHSGNAAFVQRRFGRLRRGFTLFETLVAMFVVLVGLLGVTSMFNSGMKSHIIAQELYLSQELANMWADWVRFRLNDTKGGGFYLTSADLVVGQSGDFFTGTPPSGNFAGDTLKWPTVQKQVYAGFKWSITKSSGANAYRPQWAQIGTMDVTDASGGTDPQMQVVNANLHFWDQTLSGSSTVPSAMGGAPKGLTQVELTIERGGRPYRFNFVFSGVGVRYGL